MKAGDDFIEDEISRRLSTDVLIFLIEAQDNLLDGISVSGRDDGRVRMS